MLLKIVTTTDMETLIKRYQGDISKMKKKQIRFIGYAVIVICTVFFITGYAYPVSAETGYVSDMLLLTVREGPGNSSKVLKTLRSSDAVEIIGKQDNYYKIKTSDGIIGWVEQQYITNTVPQILINAALKQKIAILDKKNRTLSDHSLLLKEKIKNMEKDFKTKISEINSSLQKKISEKNKIKSEFDQEKDKYDSLLKNTGGGPLKIIEKNKVLKQKNDVLSKKIEELTKNNEDCLKTGMIKWFLAGAGVLFAGWLIGHSIRRNKRSSGGLLG